MKEFGLTLEQTRIMFSYQGNGYISGKNQLNFFYKDKLIKKIIVILPLI